MQRGCGRSERAALLRRQEHAGRMRQITSRACKRHNERVRQMTSRVARRCARALSHLQPTGGTQSPLFDGG